MSSSKSPLFSICIPFYDGLDTLERCIQSVRTQNKNGGTFAPEDVEIVLTNDDQRPHVVEQLERQSRELDFILIHNPQQLGLTDNWQQALSSGTGDFVALLHQDDWYHEDCLSAALKEFARAPDLAALAFRAMLHKEDRDEAAAQTPGPTLPMTAGEFRDYLQQFTGVPAPSTTFFRRSMLADLPVYYDSKFEWCSEFDLLLRLTRAHPDAYFRIDEHHLINRGLSEQQFSVLNEDKRIIDYCRIFESCQTDFETPAALDKFSNHVISIISHRMAKVIKAISLSEIEKIKSVKVWFAKVMNATEFKRLVITEERTFRPSFMISMGRQFAARQHFPITELICNSTLFDQVTEQAAGELLREMHLSLHVPERKPAAIKEYDALTELIGDNDFFRRPLIICGFPHSGTRLLAELLARVGIYQEVNSPTYEWNYIQMLNSFLLPNWQQPDAIRDFAPDPAWPIPVAEVAAKLAGFGYSGVVPWGHKDPRNSATLDAWIDAFPGARVVNIVRNPLDVLGTLPDRYAKFSPNGDVPQQAIEFWTDVWIAYLEKTRQAVTRVAHAVEVRFAALCDTPIEVLSNITTALDYPIVPRPKDLNGIEILKAKVGLHRAWLREGKFSQDAFAAMRAFLSPLAIAYDLPGY